MSPAQQAAGQHALRRYDHNAGRVRRVHRHLASMRASGHAGFPWLRFADAWEDPTPALLVRAPKARVYR